MKYFQPHHCGLDRLIDKLCDLVLYWKRQHNKVMLWKILWKIKKGKITVVISQFCVIQWLPTFVYWTVGPEIGVGRALPSCGLWWLIPLSEQCCWLPHSHCALKLESFPSKKQKQFVKSSLFFFLDLQVFLPIKHKAWECLIVKVNFMFRNSPVHHCPSQHAREFVCQIRNWHH